MSITGERGLIASAHLENDIPESSAMSVHHGRGPLLAAILSAVSLSFSLPDISRAGQDLRYLSFHPVPLSASPASRVDSRVSLQTTHAEPAARAAKYRERIAELQSSDGGLALPLAEQLLALGRALQEQGDLDAALDAYAESRHVMRVNLGLDSIEQAPVFEAMFSAYAAQGDVDQAHAMQEALFNLRRRYFGYDSAEGTDAVLAWADWNVTLYLLLDPLPSIDGALQGFARMTDPRLELAYDAYTKALQRLERHAAIDDARLVTTERKLAALNFITNRKLLDTYGEAARAPASNDTLANAGNAFENASTARFNEGSLALRRALEYSERSARRRDDDVAARMVELGDWYLLFDHRAAAMELYRDALAFMRDASLPQEDVERIMSPGMPVPTPDTAYLPPVAASDYAGYVDVEFELTQFGMATKPKIIGSSEPNRQIERELLREIRGCKFRPKFVADTPVNRERVRLRYYYSL